MTIIYEERLSDSPYVEAVTRGATASDGSMIRPAASRWHMVLKKYQGTIQLLVVGPWTRSGVISYPAGAELLWIRFKLGTWMPHLATRNFLDVETILPGAAHNAFWLHGSTWEFPTYENAETFVDRLVRRDVLVHDPVVHAVLHGQPQHLAPRTVRHRFLHTTGMTYTQIRQLDRAQQAAALLQQGGSIADTMYDLGYFDQPHLTRSLKHWIGYTPGQLLRGPSPDP